jgi:hypothetical protein
MTAGIQSGASSVVRLVRGPLPVAGLLAFLAPVPAAGQT